MAAGLLIAFVRRQWFRLVPGRAPEQADFAPPARRAAPAATPVTTTSGTATTGKD